MLHACHNFNKDGSLVHVVSLIPLMVLAAIHDYVENRSISLEARKLFF